jgi:hypothetical protein
MDFTDLIESDPPVELVRPEKKAVVLPKKAQAAIMRSMEDEMHQESMTILHGATHFYKIEPDAKEPPREWVKELGKKQAWERFRLSQFALMSKKDAPVGLFLASATHASITKARATEKGGTRTLNMISVQMPAPPEYPRIEVAERK